MRNTRAMLYRPGTGLIRSASHSRLCAKDNGHGPALLRRGIVFAGGRARRSPSKRASSARRSSGSIRSSDEASEPGFIRYSLGLGRKVGNRRADQALSRAACVSLSAAPAIMHCSAASASSRTFGVSNSWRSVSSIAECPIDLADELRREQRMSPQIEEVVVASHARHAEHLGPDVGERGLDRRARRLERDRVRLRIRVPAALGGSTLPLGVSGSAGSTTKASGSM